MYRILCSGFQHSVFNAGVPLFNSSTHQLSSCLNQLSFTVRLLYTCVNRENPFVVSYLINSCGLSPQSAKAASKRVDFKTPDNPDSVLALLRDYGFTITHISKIFKSTPQLLVVDPVKILLPKLEFLCSIGFSSSHLPHIVSSNASLLYRSLDNHIIPTYNMLKTILGSDELVFQSLGRCIWNLNNMHKSFTANIALLREHNVPQQKLSFLLIYAPCVVCKDPNKFNDDVNKVIELGMNPCDKAFVQALQVISQRSHKVWEQKIELYKSLGFSEEQILLAFRKYPNCMSISAKKISSTVDFTVNKMGYQLADVVCFPAILSYNFEKRIIPRFSVIRVLQLKGLVKANVTLSYLMATTEKCFLDTFVIKYQGEVPELLTVYQGKMSIQGLGLEFEAEKNVRS